MDAARFDRLARALSSAGSRRGLLALLGTLPVVGGLAALLAAEEGQAHGRRKRRKKRHKHGRGRRRKRKHQKKKCKSRSRATTCAGKCGIVRNNCRKRVDCGSCVCEPLCPVCQICNAATGVCEPDPDEVGDACGEPGQVCQADGACACDAASCDPCQACQDDGVCAAPCAGEGCCDGTSCQPGDTNTACGAGGETCDVCTGDEFCLDGDCVVPPCTVCASGCPFTSVQDAIDAAQPGDTITICAGTYLGPNGVVDIDKNLTVIGAGDGDDPSANTILDADGTATVVRVRGTRTVTLQGLRITGGQESSNGGGINNAGDLTTSGCTVTGNRGTMNIGGPGGIFSAGPLTMTDCTVSANVTPSANAGGIRAIGGPLSLNGCTITGNEGFVGGIAIDVIMATITDTTIADNRANASGSANGGGIRVDQGTLDLIQSSVSGNQASTVGGGIINANGTVTLTESSVTDNTAGTTGGGIQNDGGTVTLDAASLVCDNAPDQCVGFSDPACQDTCPP